MCDDGYDADPSGFWRQQKRKARKQHKCWSCREAILPGHTYQVSAVGWDGQVTSWKHCLRCAELIELLKSRMDSWTTDIMDLDCGEVWEDPPPEVAALAFVLPGEVPA